MYLLLRASADIEFKYFVWLFFIYMRAGEFEVPAWVAITFWFLKDLLWMVLGYYLRLTGGGTAFGAHVGGFLAGLGLVAAYKWIGRRYEPAAESEPEASDPEPVRLAPEPIRVTMPLRPAAVPTETPTIFLHDGTQQTGPFTLSQIEAMLRSGEASTEMQYWCEGLDSWQSVTELSGSTGG